MELKTINICYKKSITLEKVSYQCLTLLKKKIIKVHFCFQKQDGRDMNTERNALPNFRSLCHRSDDYF